MVAREGFPDHWGSKLVTVITVTGPSSYTVYTGGSTGGQDVQALPNGGVKTIAYAKGGHAASGNFKAEVVQIEASTTLGVSLTRTQFILKWSVVATVIADVEVAAAVDLSGETVDVLVVGDK